jgi:predicted tellurium resistance membrane protein TerC
MATSCFAIGVLAPIASAYGNLVADHVAVHAVMTGVVLWFGMALGLERLAREALGDLRQ